MPGLFISPVICIVIFLFSELSDMFSINKSLEVVYLNKAGLLVGIGKYQEAIKYLDKALAILDDNNSRGDTIIKNKEPIEYMGIGIMENDTIYDRIYFLKSAALINLSQYDYALTLLLNIKESNSVNIFYIISRFIEYISIEKLINIILKEDSFWVEEKEEGEHEDSGGAGKDVNLFSAVHFSRMKTQVEEKRLGQIPARNAKGSPS